MNKKFMLLISRSIFVCLSPELNDQPDVQSESTDNPPLEPGNDQIENESNHDSQIKFTNEESRPNEAPSQIKKRKNDFKDASRSKKKTKDDFDMRFLISNKSAGLLIGKKGTNITFLRQHYNSSVVITDCAGPERLVEFPVLEKYRLLKC